jgi:sugar phosphate isomerase/epimerase
MVTNRRIFIQQSALLTAGLMIKPNLSHSFHKQLGLQVYTLREQIPGNVSSVFEKVAAIGYKNIEPSGYTIPGKFWGLDAKAFKAVLESNNLVSTSGMYGVDVGPTANFEDLKHYIDVAALLGEKYIVITWLYEEWRKDADAYKAIAERMNRAGEMTKKAGIFMAYHNHNFEFTDMGGKTGYDILLKETDPALVKMEMDIYWIIRGGADPVKLFHQHPGRFALWHVKDMDKTNHLLNTGIGSGVIDFKKIFANAKLAGLDYAFLEQENFSGDPYESISKSAAYIKNELFN